MKETKKKKKKALVGNMWSINIVLYLPSMIRKKEKIM